MNIPMKKFFASFVFVVVFAGYALSHYLDNSSAAYAVQNAASPAGPSVQIADTGTVAQITSPTPLSPAQPSPAVPASATPMPAAPAPVPQNQGQYVDGTYTGFAANAYYGNVQIQVTVSGGKIADVAFLQYPSDRSTSRYINDQAMPILKSEAIQAQSAQVDGVSGASDTSAAFQQSLASALAQAKS